MPDVTVHNHSNSGHPDKAKTLDGDVAVDSAKVTHPRAKHEIEPVDYKRARVEDFCEDRED